MSVRVCRAVNNALLDSYQLKSLDAVLEVPIERMKIRRRPRDGKFYVFVDGLHEPWQVGGDVNASGHHQTSATIDNFAMREPYDRVIRCLGFKFNESLFSQYVPWLNCGPRGCNSRPTTSSGRLFCVLVYPRSS